MNSALTHVATIKANCPFASEVCDKLQKTTSRHVFVETKRTTTGLENNICVKGAISTQNADAIRANCERIIKEVESEKLVTA